jgi:hypothetical protein
MRFEINSVRVAGPTESILSTTASEIQARTVIGCRVAISDRVRLISTVSWTLGPLELIMFDVWSGVIDGFTPRYGHDQMIIVGPWAVTDHYIMYNGDAIEHIIPVRMRCTGFLQEFTFHDRNTRRCLGSSPVVVKMLIICAMVAHGAHHLY